jgi:hypothetical protein
VAHLFFALPFPFVLVAAAGRLVEYHAQAAARFGLDATDWQHGPLSGWLTMARVTQDGLQPWPDWITFCQVKTCKLLTSLMGQR